MTKHRLNPFEVSPALRGALAAWLADARSDTPSFDAKEFGLCHYVSAALPNSPTTWRELTLLFRTLGMDWSCPFDPAGTDYWSETDKSKSPARRAFVELVLAMNPEVPE